MSANWELAMLSGPPLNTPLPWLDPWAHTSIEQTYQQSEETISATLKSSGWGSGTKLHDAMVASGLIDILDPLIEALDRANITLPEFFALDKDRLTDFLRDVPSRWVLYEMRGDLHARGQHEPNDLRDLTALSIAATYCDIVITEKQWVHVLRKAGIAEMMGTVIVRNVQELPEALI
jgi:hypothetical protein